jgi:hypothetical protein
MFDLESYEDVNSRIKRFRETHVSGRIETQIIDIDITKGYILIQASVYREHEDLVPSAINYAFEIRSERGVNRDFWVENAVTSAVGRAIGLLMPSEKRPTKQDMEKVERLSHVPAQSDPWATFTVSTSEAESVGDVLQLVSDKLGGEIVEATPVCAHGRMVDKRGSKNGRAYSGWLCPVKNKADQCPAQWDAVARLEDPGWNS